MLPGSVRACAAVECTTPYGRKVVSHCRAGADPNSSRVKRGVRPSVGVGGSASICERASGGKWKAWSVGSVEHSGEL